MSPLRAFGLLLLLACCLLPSALAQDGGNSSAAIPSGGACGNRDTCESGYICVGNSCQSSLLLPDSLEGTGNSCSESDCCREGLSCFQGIGNSSNSCLPIDSDSASLVVVCGGSGAGNNNTGGNGTDPVPVIPGLPLGSACANWDTCEDGICLSNKCVALNNTGQANGAGNLCSATNCCPSGLTCGGSPVSVCLMGTDDVDSVSCENDDNGGDNGTVTFPEQLAGEYSACDNDDACGVFGIDGVGGLMCIANRCVRREWYPNVTEGLGNRCDQTNCCGNNLTCSLSLGLCRQPNDDNDGSDDDALLCGGVVIPEPGQGGENQTSTGGQEPTTPDQGGVDQSTGDDQTPTPAPQPQPTVPADGVAEGGACDNNRLCSGDLRCLSNRCQSGVDLPYGYGNACSADNCCYRGQVCVSDGNVCAPQQTQDIGLSIVQCSGTQPEPVDGDGDSLNDRGAASAIGVSSALLALLALAGALMAAM